MPRPAWPLSSMDTSRPASPPTTQDNWCRVSDTANADERTSSLISRCTMESCASFASPVQSAATNATTSAVPKPKNHAHTPVTTVARASMTYIRVAGACDPIADPMPIATRAPAAAAATIAPSATLCDTPAKFCVRSRKARKKIM